MKKSEKFEKKKFEVKFPLPFLKIIAFLLSHKIHIIASTIIHHLFWETLNFANWNNEKISKIYVADKQAKFDRKNHQIFKARGQCKKMWLFGSNVWQQISQFWGPVHPLLPNFSLESVLSCIANQAKILTLKGATTFQMSS